MVRWSNHTDIGAAMYWVVCSRGAHTASQACAQDCTVVYGDRRGIAGALTGLDAGAVHGLHCRGWYRNGEAIERTLGRDKLLGHSGVVLIVVNRSLECS